MSKRIAIAALALAALALPALAQEGTRRPAAPLQQMLPGLDKFLALPLAQRDKIDLLYRFRFNGQPIKQGDVWLEPEGKRVDIPVDAEGNLQWRQAQPYLAGNPTVYTRLPKGGGEINLRLTPNLPLAQTIALADMRSAMGQANAAIRKQAGMLSMLAPQMRGVAFALPAGATAEWHQPDGTVKPLTRNPKTGNLEFKPGKKDKGSLHFSAAPTDDAFIE